MPFVKRAISPVKLCSKPVDESDKFDLNVICNNALVAAINQLASLTYHADDLFAELSQECHQVFERTDALNQRVINLEQNIDKLDFRTAKIPEGNLQQFGAIGSHFASNVFIERNLFLPKSRPESLRDVYQCAELNPGRVIAQCNKYRSDDLSGSRLFALTPVFVEKSDVENKSVEMDMSARTQRTALSPAAMTAPRHRSMAALHSASVACGGDAASSGGHEASRVSMREMSASQPNDLVPIDTSGSAFNRMCQYRESLKSASHENMDGGKSGTSRMSRRRHRRHQTVSGLPGSVPGLPGSLPPSHLRSHPNVYGVVTDGAAAISPATRSGGEHRQARSVSSDRILERPHSMAYLDRYAPRDDRFYKSREELRRDRIEREKSVEREERRSLDRSCSLRRSMRSLFRAPEKEKCGSTDLWADGRPRSPGPLMIDVRGRRARSLPRSLKSVRHSVVKFVKSRSSSTEGRLDDHPHKRRPLPPPADPFAANEFVTHVVKPKSKGLFRSLTQRMSRSQSNVSSHSTTKSTKSSSSKKRQQSVVTSPVSSSGRPVAMTTHTTSRGRARPKSMDVRQHMQVQQQQYQQAQEQRSMQEQQRYARSAHNMAASAHSVTSHPVNTASMGDLAAKHRVNVPPGKAWRAFGEVNYRQHKGNKHADRQSSSGNWSGTESMRFSAGSLGSTGLEVPDRSSFSSHDRDSAISCTHGYPYLGRFADRHNTLTLSTISGTDCSAAEDDVISTASTLNDVTSIATSTAAHDVISIASTVNDTATIPAHSDSEDTLNGSVVALNKNETKVKEKPPSSGKKSAKKDEQKRKRRRSRKNKEAENDEACLTVRNIQTHDKAYKTTVSAGKVTDDETSLYSVDQDGFYTSMHKDSGIQRTAFEMFDEVPASVLATYDSKLIQKVDEQIKRKHSRGKSTSGPPPPPPPRISSRLSNGPASLATSLSMSQSQTSLSSLNDQLDRLHITASSLSLASIQSHDSKSANKKSSPSAVSNTSDTDAIFSRVKLKSNISSAGYPSLCKVTPTNSDDEQNSTPKEENNFSKNEQNKDTHKSQINGNTKTEKKIPVPHEALKKSAKLAPHITDIKRVDTGFGKGVRQSSFRLMINAMLESSYEKSDRSLDDSVISLEFDLAGMDLIDTSVYSTWPRQPKLKPAAEANEESTNEQAVAIKEENDAKNDMKIVENKVVKNEIEMKVTAQPGVKPYSAHRKDVNHGVLETKPMTSFTHTYPDVLENKPASNLQNNENTKEKLKKPKTPKSKIKSKQSPSKSNPKKSSSTELHSEETIYQTDDTNDEDKMSTWPKKDMAVKSSPSKSGSGEKISSEISSKTFTDPDEMLSWSSTFPRRKDKSQTRQRTVDTPSSLALHQDPNNTSSALAPITQSPENFGSGFIDTDMTSSWHGGFAKNLSEGSSTMSQSMSNANTNTPQKRGKHPGALVLTQESVTSDTSSTSGPQPAQARLIISSPVSSQAAYVPNPHQRSLCSPVSEQDFHVFSFQTPPKEGAVGNLNSPLGQTTGFTYRSNVVKSNTMFEFGAKSPTSMSGNFFSGSISPRAMSPDSKPLSEPLYPSISAMKHSITFPYTVVRTPENRSRNNNNKHTWYGNLDQSKPINIKPSKHHLKKSVSINENRLSYTGYPFADFLDDGYLCSFGTNGDKRWSGFSTTSKTSTDSTGSGSAKRSVTSEKRISRSSLTSEGSMKSGAPDVVSVGSTQTNDSVASATSRSGVSGAGSLLEAYRHRKNSDVKNVSFNLKNKFGSLKSSANTTTKSASNLPMPSLPVMTSSKKRTSESLESQLPVKPVKEEKAHAQRIPSLSASLISPTKLKRTSAVLDEDFDVFSVEIPVIDSSESTPSTPVHPSAINAAKTDYLLNLFASNSKRKCVGGSPTVTALNIATPNKTSLARRYRLRRTLSKGKINASRSSLNTSTESILRSPTIGSGKPFTFDLSLSTSFESEHSQVNTNTTNTQNESKSLSQRTHTVKKIETKPDVHVVKSTSKKTAAIHETKKSETTHVTKTQLSHDTQVTSHSSSKKGHDSKSKKAESKSGESSNSVSSQVKKSITSRLPTPHKVRPTKDSVILKTTNKPVDQVDTKTRKTSDPKDTRGVDKTLKGHESKPEKHVKGSSEVNVKKEKEGKEKKSKSSPKKERTSQSAKTSAFEGVEVKNRKSSKPTPLQFTLPKSLNTDTNSKPSSKRSSEISSIPPSNISASLQRKSSFEEARKISTNQNLELNAGVKTTPSPVKDSPVTKIKKKRAKKLKSSSVLDLQSRDLQSEPISDKLTATSSNTQLNAAAIKSSNHDAHLRKNSPQMAKSLSNLSCLSLVGDSASAVYDSELSLAKSTDSLASNSATDRIRAAKLAFLNQQNNTESREQTTGDDPFSKYNRRNKSRSRSEFSKKRSKSSTSVNSNVDENALRLHTQGFNGRRESNV